MLLAIPQKQPKRSRRLPACTHERQADLVGIRRVGHKPRRQPAHVKATADAVVLEGRALLVADEGGTARRASRSTFREALSALQVAGVCSGLTTPLAWFHSQSVRLLLRISVDENRLKDHAKGAARNGGRFLPMRRWRSRNSSTEPLMRITIQVLVDREDGEPPATVALGAVPSGDD